MTRPHDDNPPAAVSAGDGSLGGPAIGGTLTGPDAGEIQDEVGREMAVPVGVEPDPPALRDDPTFEPAVARPRDEDAHEQDEHEPGR